MHIFGKYCLVKATFNQTRNDSHEVMLWDFSQEWTWSICIPASCSANDLIRQLEFSLEGVADHVEEVHCKSSLDDNGPDFASWSMIFLTLAFIVFVLAATWIEYCSIEIPYQPANSVIPSFSLITNLKVLLNTASPGCMIDNIQGIRVISTLAVYAFHRANIYYYLSIVNHSEVVHKLTHSMLGMLFLNGILAVDSFFLIGGTVLALSFTRERKAQIEFSYFKHVVYRYLRLTPAYFFVVLMVMTFFYDLGDGPFWDLSVGAGRDLCRKNWWTNILYINNYLPRVHEESCIGWTWYLGADMQFYLVAPLFLSALLKNWICGVLLIAVTCLASCSYIFWITYIKDYPPTFILGYNRPKRLQYQDDLYFPAHARISPYLIGLLLGCLLNHHKENKMKIGFWPRVIGWTLSMIIMVTVPYGLTFYYWFGSGPLVAALYSSLHRPLFVLAISWVIFVCDQGYGGFVNRFLSLQLFQILSRLTFSFYLIHILCMEYDFATRRTAEYFSYYNMLQAMAFEIIVLLLASAVLSLTLEYPIIHLNKLFMKKKTEDISKFTQSLEVVRSPPKNEPESIQTPTITITVSDGSQC
nr:PREDICTED: nose resistant to fluoxetine protein 6-like [Bemisia tabaci]